VNLRAIRDAVVKRKIPNPSRESNPRTPQVLSMRRVSQLDVRILYEHGWN